MFCLLEAYSGCKIESSAHMFLSFFLCVMGYSTSLCPASQGSDRLLEALRVACNLQLLQAGGRGLSRVTVFFSCQVPQAACRSTAVALASGLNTSLAHVSNGITGLVPFVPVGLCIPPTQRVTFGEQISFELWAVCPNLSLSSDLWSYGHSERSVGCILAF